ncbi:hypothetical protein F441_11778 [Phytophthora nicotianae CJ01A1]|uniref:Uncharacterized protein n=2 Tax=Phytophthora nicotianae TaxID=4792 RepID=W2WQV3_PHYNI|nr:hypothetical protein L916_11442 [Phytophthora nicotianae]ETP12935.1 hypothetical protein F441_11778 [Phytophthora nicotianae CJ01A1]
MSKAMCVKALFAYDCCVENAYQYRLSRIERFMNTNYDDEMGMILQLTTHYVAQHIEQQYASGLAKASSYNYVNEPEGFGVVLVNGVFSEYKLNVDSWRCDCEFSMSMKLPFRHAIAYRKHTKVLVLAFSGGGIDERWTSTSQVLKKGQTVSYEKFSDAEQGSSIKKLRTHTERYREAVRATDLIAN